jgi:hypothetical protein
MVDRRVKEIIAAAERARRERDARAAAKQESESRDKQFGDAWLAVFPNEGSLDEAVADSLLQSQHQILQLGILLVRRPMQPALVVAVPEPRISEILLQGARVEDDRLVDHKSGQHGAGFRVERLHQSL